MDRCLVFVIEVSQPVGQYGVEPIDQVMAIGLAPF